MKQTKPAQAMELRSFVYVATFMHAIRGLVTDENGNAGVVKVVADLKAFGRRVGVPVLVEAHAGKGEDQSADADPTLALRGATAGGNSPTRVLSGLGRLVNFPPVVFDVDTKSGAVTVLTRR
jgi:hypothetical protein